MNNSKNVLVVTALSGFVRAFLLDDIRILQSMGYKVYCAANGENDDRKLEENINEFRKMGVIFMQVSFSSNKPLSKTNWHAYRKIKKILKETQFSAIHIHTPIPGVIVRMAAQKYRKKCKVIYTTHGFYFHKGCGIKKWVVYYVIEKIMSIFSDAIITINKEDYNNAKRMFCKRVFHINGVGVETERYNILVDRSEMRKKLNLSETDVAILSVGELSERKNHQVIINAMEIEGNSNLIYLICGKAIEGEGTYGYLKQLAKEKKVRVVFLGYRKDIPEISKAVDIGAIPSTREGLGLAGIEMLAAGLPLLAAKVHGIVDYAVDGKTGYLANPYSPEEFADNIKKLENKEVRNRMKKNCYEMSKKFDMSVSHKQRQEIYYNILGKE